jgi:hypothetical protein
MTPGEIKKALHERNLTMAGIGRRLRPRVTPKSVQTRGRPDSRLFEQADPESGRKAIGREEQEVFGTAA